MRTAETSSRGTVPEPPAVENATCAMKPSLVSAIGWADIFCE